MAVKQSIPSYTNTNKSLTLGNFKGIDASSSPFEVDVSRATYCQNLINENGVNHKRPGWKTILSLNKIGTRALFHWNLNGNKRFLAIGIKKENGMCDLFINLYRYTKSDFSDISEIWENKSTISEEEFNMMADLYKIDFEKFYCFIKEDKVFVFGTGEVTLIYNDELLSIDGRSIESGKGLETHTYIPTTTISINRDSQKESTRQSKEHANLLSKYRRNTLLGTNLSKESCTLNIIPKDASDMTAVFSGLNVSIKDSADEETSNTTGSFLVESGTYVYTVKASGYVCNQSEEERTVTITTEDVVSGVVNIEVPMTKTQAV